MSDDVISEETFGIVFDEHYDPKKSQPFSPTKVFAERREYSDRTFYVLVASDSHDHVAADLDERGWRDLRDICEDVLARIASDSAPEEEPFTPGQYRHARGILPPSSSEER